MSHLIPTCDVHRFDVGDLIDVGARFAPGEEARAGVEIGGAGVRVLDRDGEEFEEAARAVVAGGGDQGATADPPSATFATVRDSVGAKSFREVNANSFGFGPSDFAE